MLLVSGTCHTICDGCTGADQALAQQDIVGARRALDDYRMKDASFEQQREYKFLVQLVQVVEDRDEEAL